MVILLQDYKEIRRLFLDGVSIREISKMLNISRNTVKKYCEGEVLPGMRKTPERLSTVLTADVIQFINDCLDEDEKEGLKKQKHTGRRIFERLVKEKGFTGAESTIRHKVKEINDLRQAKLKGFVPLQFDPGETLQVDWGEAAVYFGDERLKINLFCARLCYSCRPIVLAYSRQNQESFFRYFRKSF